MYALEIGFLLAALALLVAQNVRGFEPKYLRGLAAAGAALVLLAAFMGQLRWPMAATYLVFALSCLFLLKRSHAHVAVRSLGVAAGALLLAVSAFLAAGLPVLKLPARAGPYVVGTTSVSLLDESRDNAVFGAPDEKRELYVQIWYPGVVENGEPETPVRTM